MTAAAATAGTGPSPAGDVVEAARQLAPAVSGAAEEIEATGRLPQAIVDGFTAAGLFELYRPASCGGPEVDPLRGFLAIEVLARADASAAWCAHVSSANSWQTAALPPATVRAMDARRFSGSARPLGRATPVEGGVVVDGRWDFASNCLHAEWYCGTCTFDDADGRRRARPVFVPIDAGSIIDTWQVAGLRGTGSNDFAVQGVFVPDERVCSGRNLRAQPGRLYAARLSMVVNWALTAGVALGLARGALDAFDGLAGEGTSGTVDTPLRERSAVQGAVGRATAMLGAARAYCLDAVTAVWEAAAEPDEGDDDRRLDELIPPARLSIVHAMQTAVDVTALLFEAGGTRAVFNRHGLERRFRDARVATQHVAGSPAHYEAAGRLTLGLPAAAPFW